jgi:hypothetical protein
MDIGSKYLAEEERELRRFAATRTLLGWTTLQERDHRFRASGGIARKFMSGVKKMSRDSIRFIIIAGDATPLPPRKRLTAIGLLRLARENVAVAVDLR